MNIKNLIFYLILFFIFKKKFYLKKEFFGIDKFDSKIFIINLEKDKDRWDSISKQCIQNDLNFVRFNAINGNNVSKKKINEYFAENVNLNPGQIGCALSHIKIWEYSLKNNYDHILILEDDAILPNNFKDRVKPILNSLPSDWDYLSLNCAYCEGYDYNQNLIKVSKNICTVSYFISRKGMSKILNIIKENKIRIPIDNFLHKFFFNNSNSFLAKDHFVLMNIDDFESNIGVGNVGKNHKITYLDKIN